MARIEQLIHNKSARVVSIFPLYMSEAHEPEESMLSEAVGKKHNWLEPRTVLRAEKLHTMKCAACRGVDFEFYAVVSVGDEDKRERYWLIIQHLPGKPEFF